MAARGEKKTWRCGRFRFSLSRPLVMGVVNVTPDSFSDGGAHADAESAVAHGLRLLESGADIVDVGGESTRPGALAVRAEAEKRRVLPVIERLAARGIAVSADTMKPAVMRAALAHGACALNDVNAFRARGAAAAAAESDCGVVVMHMRGTPRTMQRNPEYGDVVSEVADFLRGRAAALERAGVARGRICVDPGIGFGKTLSHNLELLRNLRRLAGGYPLLVGASRKSFLGRLTGRENPSERDAAGAALSALLFGAGAWGIRTHGPAGVRDAWAVASALADESGAGRAG